MVSLSRYKMNFDEMEHLAARILGIDATETGCSWAECLGYGMRTSALISPLSGVSHKYQQQFDRVVLKLFRRTAAEHVCFHASDFAKFESLSKNGSLQKSVTGGTFEGRSYAVVEYISGTTLRSNLNSKLWTFDLDSSLE